MIDTQSLKQLGWSDELIAATTRAAESLRAAEPHVGDMPEMRSYSVSSSSLNVAMNVTNTNQGFYIPAEEARPDREAS